MTTIKKICWKKERERERAGKRMKQKKASCGDVAWEFFFFGFLFCLLPFFMMIGDETRNKIVFSVI